MFPFICKGNVAACVMCMSDAHDLQSQSCSQGLRPYTQTLSLQAAAPLVEQTAAPLEDKWQQRSWPLCGCLLSMHVRQDDGALSVHHSINQSNVLEANGYPYKLMYDLRPAQEALVHEELKLSLLRLHGIMCVVASLLICLVSQLTFGHAGGCIDIPVKVHGGQLALPDLLWQRHPHLP